jgi:hypothetical protein
MSNEYTEGFISGAIMAFIMVAIVLVLSNWTRRADGPPAMPPYHKIEVANG